MHHLLLFTILLAFLYTPTTKAQVVPSIHTEKDTLTVYLEGKKDIFPHHYQSNPLHYTLLVKSPDTISFVSEADSIAFIIHSGDSLIVDVVREQGQDTLHCLFNIVEKQEHASFSKEYIRTHQGKTSVEVPEVYELVNIVYALTPTGKTDANIVRQKTPYYDEVIRYFGKYEQQPIVKVLDSLLQMGKYSYLKMDAYAFFFRGNQIKKSATFNIVSWENYNTLEPYMESLQSFAHKSGFRKFYARHQRLYEKQMATYRDSIDTNKMRRWLEKHFPASRYDAVKIIFSPLVSGNQSECHFDNNGFKELQAHVNYPYRWQKLEQYPPNIAMLLRGEIVFTELNHGYINPEADKAIHRKGINDALKDLSKWTDKKKSAGNYNSPYMCFNEYMNWGLVSLYYVDYASGEYLPELIGNMENMMVKDRGLIKFAEFNRFLEKLYQNRQEGQILADLYPQIIDWFAAN